MDQDHLLSNKLYNLLKPIATTILPAVAALYIALASTWDLPNPDKVAATVAAVNAFLGVFLGVSSKSWNNSEAKYDGSMEVTGYNSDTGIPDVKLTLTKDPRDLLPDNVKTVRLKAPTAPAA